MITFLQLIFAICLWVANLCVIQHAYYMKSVSWYLIVWIFDLGMVFWVSFISIIILKQTARKRKGILKSEEL